MHWNRLDFLVKFIMVEDVCACCILNVTPKLLKSVIASTAVPAHSRYNDGASFIHPLLNQVSSSKALPLEAVSHSLCAG